jgi:outer membrane lipase/esterase
MMIRRPFNNDNGPSGPSCNPNRRHSMLDLSRQAARLSAAFIAAVLLASCGGSDDVAPVPRFQRMVVVGASGTDTGNRCGFPNDPDPLCFPTPAYAGPSTASNGPLFNQLVAANYNSSLTASSAGGLNFAIGGAMTGAIPTDAAAPVYPTLLAQLEQFLQRVGFAANPQYLYVVDASAFGNNVRRVLNMVGANPALAQTLPTQAVTQAATDIFNVLTRLYAAGARHVVLVNSSNLGLHPAVAAQGAGAIQLATGMSLGFNGALATQVVPSVRAGSAGLNLYYVDFGALANEIAANPAGFGITNTMAPCYPFFSNPAAPICATPAQFLFWDELHPSAAVHAVAAQRTIAVIGP